MRTSICSLACLALLGLSGCSNDTAPKPDEVHVIQAGEKAGIGHLTYSVVDCQIVAKLGTEPSVRVPHDRFIMLQIAVTNSSNVDNPIPTISLVSDSGQTYGELGDGTGVTNWLGVFRHVGSGQTERGVVLFDAPAAHYRVRVTDEQSDKEMYIDLPLSVSHVKADDEVIPGADIPEVGTTTVVTPGDAPVAPTVVPKSATQPKK